MKAIRIVWSQKGKNLDSAFARHSETALPSSSSGLILAERAAVSKNGIQATFRITAIVKKFDFWTYKPLLLTAG
jgi:hypothetical protein